MRKKYCPFCYNKLVKSNNKDYAYQCLYCDEDFFSFEVLNEPYKI